MTQKIYQAIVHLCLGYSLIHFGGNWIPVGYLFAAGAMGTIVWEWHHLKVWKTEKRSSKIDMTVDVLTKWGGLLIALWY